MRAVDERKPDAVQICVFALVVMATWTLVIKFLAPILYVVAEEKAGNPGVAAPIMWDFWWVAHLWLAHLMWYRHRWAWWAAALISWVEVVIVVVKFFFYLRDPIWDLWHLLWFVNKVYVLVFFLILSFLLIRPWFKRQLEG